MGSFLTFPTGVVHWLFGYGFRLYGTQAMIHGYASSDIGYINDLFMGGLLYVVLLYASIFFFIYVTGYRNRGSRILIVPYTMMLLIANYKGEAMRSGLILTAILALIYLFSTSGESKIERES